MGVAPASHGLLGRIQRANDVAAHRFGPHTAEVEAFIVAVGQLTPWQWRQVRTTKRLVASVSKDGAGATDSARSIQSAIRSSDGRISEPMARAGEVLFDTLAKKSDDKQVAAWQSMTALIMRSNLPALKFAVHYAPFATLIPLSGSDVLDPRTRRFISLLEELTRDRLAGLAKRWRVDAAASRALLQAVAKHRHAKSEEAVAVAALSFIPHHLVGDEGWTAVRTAVHGGRVLSALGDLTAEETAQLWSPLEATIALASLDVEDGANSQATTRSTRRVPAAPPAKTAAAYGPNHAEVAAFIRGVAELSAIQWLRVLDRRKLVASVTREGAVEPAGVVRSILIALEATRELDTYSRCRAFAAVERAGYVIESHGGVNLEQVRQALTPFEPSIEFEALNGGGFAHQVATLARADWRRALKRPLQGACRWQRASGRRGGGAGGCGHGADAPGHGWGMGGRQDRGVRRQGDRGPDPPDHRAARGPVGANPTRDSSCVAQRACKG